MSVPRSAARSSPRAAIGSVTSWPSTDWNCPATISLVTPARSMAIISSSLGGSSQRLTKVRTSSSPRSLDGTERRSGMCRSMVTAAVNNPALDPK